jgi:hypothetical protein
MPMPTARFTSAATENNAFHTVITRPLVSNSSDQPHLRTRTSLLSAR